MIKKIYHFFYFIAIFVLFITTVAVFILFQKDVVPYLAQKYLKEYGIEYSLVEGTLFNGVFIKDLKYEKSIKIDELRVKYNLLMLINPTPRIKYIGVKGAYIDADEILKSSGSKTKSSNFAFNISKIDLKNSNIHYKNELYSLNLSGSDFSFRDKIDFKKIKLESKTPYGFLSLEGEIKADNLRAKSTVLVDDKVKNQYLNFLTYIPQKLNVDLDISMKKLSIKTFVKKITFKDIENLELNSANISFIYDFKDDFFVVVSDYNLLYGNNKALVTQETLVTFDEKFESKLNAEIIKQDLDLPFKSFAIKIKKDKNLTKINFDAQDIRAEIDTKDYKNFILKADTIYAGLDGKFEIDNNTSTLNAKLYPKKDAPFIKEYYSNKFSKIDLFISKDNDSIKGGINADIFSLTFFNDEKGFKGFAKAGSNSFNIEGDLNKKAFRVDSSIESLKTLLHELDLDLFDEDIFFDAGADIKTDIFYKDELEIKTRLDIPWYKLQLNSEKIYMDKDAYFEFFYKNSQVTLQRYSFGFAGHKVYSDRASKVLLNEKGDIELKEFWVYDNLLLKGVVKPSDMSVDVKMKSDKFNYKSNDADLTLKIDLQVSIDSSGKQSAAGDITVLDGMITYAPKKEYIIGDEDIIIIQDIKSEEKKVDRELNIYINSLKPIIYKIKEADLLFTPNLTIYQELNTPMQILGMITVNKGSINISDKIFEFDESEIYFIDEKYTNPFLNLNLHYYTLDNNIDIEIYITNRVNSPVIIFSSTPQMSQEDIMSYILFGASASSVFDTSEGGSKTSLSSLLLGAGLKELFNKSTNLKIDTLNILTNEEGTLGYEIGARFNKNIRLVYRNDEISSIILQYSISKSIRVDVEATETGQGVGIYYIKDFKLKE